MTGKLLGSYIIGSVARGEQDDKSDLDVLVIVEDGRGRVDESAIQQMIPRKFDAFELGISWYGKNRILDMFSNGELFSWHIWKEHIVLFEEKDFSLKSLGPPTPYKGALADITSFEKVLSRIPDFLDVCPNNAVYELGLIYVCLRNIAMSASSQIEGVPDFSRYSPFRLAHLGVVPMSKAHYDLAMRCRMAGQRGIEPPKEVSPALVVECFLQASAWINHLKEFLHNERSQ